jgi:hypothetical protein
MHPKLTADCAKCGNPFNPKWLKTFNRYSSVCPGRALLNLARLCEEQSPEDSVKDISEGEQAEARIRALVEGRCMECGNPLKLKDNGMDKPFLDCMNRACSQHDFS